MVCMYRYSLDDVKCADKTLPVPNVHKGGRGLSDAQTPTHPHPCKPIDLHAWVLIGALLCEASET